MKVNPFVASFFRLAVSITVIAGTLLLTTIAFAAGPSTNAPIVLTCSTDIVATATSPGGATVFFTITASGGCSPPSIMATPPSGSTFPVGTTTVNVTASDTCGHSTNCSFQVTVTQTPIVLTCPSDMVVTSSTPTTVFFMVTAGGGCSPPSIMATPPSGSTFPIGTTTVYTTASDNCGNTTNCSFNVTVVPPNCQVSIFCPSNIVVTSSVPTTVFFTVSASDSCGGIPSVFANPPSGSTFPLGTTTVYSTAIDTNGTNQCSFTVTVVPPNCQVSIFCPSNIVVTSSVPTTVFFTVSASDSCGGIPSVFANPPSGSTFPLGTTTVYSTAIDTNGTNQCSFTVTVVPPNCQVSIFCPSNIVVTSSVPTTVFFTVSASDSCGGIPSVFANPPSGSTFPLGTTTVYSTAIDTNGTNQCSFTVTVVPPNCQVSIFCPSNIVVTSSVPTTVFFTVSASDSCGGIPSVFANPPSGSTFPLGTTTVYSTAIDTNGTNQCSFTVTVVPPNCQVSIFCPSNIVVTSSVPTTVFFTVSASDSCGGIPSVFANPPSGSTFPLGTTTVYSTAIDTNGTNQCSFTVTVVAPTNTTPIYLTCSTDIVVTATDSNGAVVFYNVTASGGCDGNPTISADWPSGSTFPIGTTQVNITAYDTCANTNTCSFNVTVNPPPTYTLSGFILGCQTNGAPIPLVTVTLSGAGNATTVTDTNGFFAFSNLLSGDYTVTPLQADNAFTPDYANVTLNSDTVLPAFVGSSSLIQGLITYGTNGPGIGAVLVQLTGPETHDALTDTNGYYVFPNLTTGYYTVTPVSTNGFIITPTNTAVALTETNCTGLANFTSSARTVLLVALEVNQVIQDWSNSVSLIQNKETYVRAFLQLAPTNNGPVLVQGARLYGTGTGGPFPDSPLVPLNTNGSLLVQTTNVAALRGQLNSSLNFRLPSDWLDGAVTLQFVCSNNVTVIPTNTVSPNRSVQISFVPSSILQVKWFNLIWTNNAGNQVRVDDATMGDMPRRLLSIYPVASVRSRFGVQTLGRNVMKAGFPDLDKVNEQLSAQWLFDWLFVGGSGNQVYFGVLAKSGNPPLLGLANGIPGNVSCGYLPVPANQANFYTIDRHTPAHEIGHDLGRPHSVSQALFGTSVISGTTYANGTPACARIVGPTNVTYPLFQRIPPPAGPLEPALGPMSSGVNSLIYGLDTLTLKAAPAINPVVDPNIYFDLMSYCDVAPLDVWESTYTYNALYNSITNRFAQPPPPPGTGGPSRTWLFVRGVIDYATGLIQFTPFVSVTTTATNNLPMPPPGNYSLMLYDANSNLLDAIPFTPDQYVVEEDDDPTGGFIIPVPADPAIRTVQIWSNGVPIASLGGSTNLPSLSNLTLSSTNGGPFTGSGPLELSWNGLDADPNAQLTYMIQYSPDGGQSWEMLGLDVEGGSDEIDTDDLPASMNGMIRVIANDGFNSSAPVYSSFFTISNHPPVVNLLTPPGGTLFVGDQQLMLEAATDDLQDGPLDGASVQWTSSLDGVLGFGDLLMLDADALSEGQHTITVTATDSLGLMNSDNVTIYVLRQPPPQLNIQMAGSQVVLSWPASVTNFVLETTASLAPSAWTTVTNTPAVLDIQQNVTLNRPASAQFFRLRLQ